MNAIMYGAIFGMICGVVWVFGGLSGMLIVLALTLIGALIGTVIWKFGGIKSLISQLVSDE
ncbi:hypothetical protein [Lentilactobacillus otakiensis]|uniref:DUF2273 domain-containing protein n=1 Tax=Lentilactobacillus otakiensis DSM 19908 = JCM 15040 TaxID=1423780 RepID=S4PN06_9LACO|nr:hypothetical protein [Lentilactobacillus otakiensis]KRL09382.1 hypothetical protein FD05_GL001480 [Lentilactobacillus otakiensis DSM 19908 = JCM 15040]MBZ3776564.1 hypothetical protein [Lentilactobacillus otakiensis]MDV3517477.1 hypothetical protein [Lentilactobacillus otakiensis]GAD15610.1 conserved hypothetical protein [Lentilactobacillus otakiensis DSM 19908 = JCM 15040]